MTENDKALLVSMIANGFEFHENMAAINGKTISTEELDRVATEGVKAIDRAVPKKPEYYGDGYSNGELVYDYAKCPECGKDDFEYDINNWGCKYCPDCGQALDWSESK